MLAVIPATGQAADNYPQRIVSLAPANTEILYALNLGDKIVGVTSYCNYPPQARQKEKIGDFTSPSIEKIVSLKPDLVLATGLEQDPAVNSLRRLGLNVVVVDPHNFQQLFDNISQIGKLTGTSTYAYILNQSLLARISDVNRKISERGTKPPRIFMEISLQPLMTVGPGSFIAEMMNMLRAINIGSTLPRAYCRVNQEFILEQDPEWLVLSSPGARDYFLKNPVFAKVSAVAKKQIIDDIDPDLLMRPGPRLVDGLEQLADKIYGIKSR